MLLLKTQTFCDCRLSTCGLDIRPKFTSAMLVIRTFWAAAGKGSIAAATKIPTDASARGALLRAPHAKQPSPWRTLRNDGIRSTASVNYSGATTSVSVPL
jgi:hypothetical protein